MTGGGEQKDVNNTQKVVVSIRISILAENMAVFNWWRNIFKV